MRAAAIALLLVALGCDSHTDPDDPDDQGSGSSSTGEDDGICGPLYCEADGSRSVIHLGTDDMCEAIVVDCAAGLPCVDDDGPLPYCPSVGSPCPGRDGETLCTVLPYSSGAVRETAIVCRDGAWQDDDERECG